LRTLLERYRLLNLGGMGIGGGQQVHIALRAVFINVRTNVQIAEVTALFGSDDQLEPHVSRPRRSYLFPGTTLSDDTRQPRI